MNLRLASKNLLILCALTAGMLLVIWGLLALGVEQWLIPDPATVAEELVQAFGAQRIAGVRELLQSDYRKQMNEAEVQALAERVEQTHRGIRGVKAVQVERNGKTASVTLAVQFEDQMQRTVSLPLAKENNQWLVTSLEGLRALASP